MPVDSCMLCKLQLNSRLQTQPRYEFATADIRCPIRNELILQFVPKSPWFAKIYLIILPDTEIQFKCEILKINLQNFDDFHPFGARFIRMEQSSCDLKRCMRVITCRRILHLRYAADSRYKKYGKATKNFGGQTVPTRRSRRSLASHILQDI